MTVAADTSGHHRPLRVFFLIVGLFNSNSDD